jgi:hypothetical protein
MFAVMIVIYPPSPVMFEYLPMMKAFLTSFKVDGSAVIVSVSSDPTTGTVVMSNKIQIPIPMILFFIV